MISLAKRLQRVERVDLSIPPAFWCKVKAHGQDVSVKRRCVPGYDIDIVRRSRQIDSQVEGDNTIIEVVRFAAVERYELVQAETRKHVQRSSRAGRKEQEAAGQAASC